MVPRAGGPQAPTQVPRTTTSRCLRWMNWEGKSELLLTGASASVALQASAGLGVCVALSRGCAQGRGAALRDVNCDIQR